MSQQEHSSKMKSGSRTLNALGKWLIAAGVAVWPVWGALLLSGRAPHIGLAVVSHLVLVVPGGMLMRRESKDEPPALVRRKRLGTLLIMFGVSAWLPYFIAQEVSGNKIESIPFLMWHLSGVIPGALLRYTKLGFRP